MTFCSALLWKRVRDEWLKLVHLQLRKWMITKLMSWSCLLFGIWCEEFHILNMCKAYENENCNWLALVCYCFSFSFFVFVGGVGAFSTFLDAIACGNECWNVCRCSDILLIFSIRLAHSCIVRWAQKSCRSALKCITLQFSWQKLKEIDALLVHWSN